MIRAIEGLGPRDRSEDRIQCRWAAYVLAAVTIWVGVGSGSASAHVIMGTKSLHLRVAESELIVRGRVVDPASVFVSTDGRIRRALVEIEVLETLKGRTTRSRIRFAQDGHEVARYRAGQQALFFLDPIARSVELRALAVPDGPSHVSGQEHDDLFLIEAARGDVLLSATKDLIASESAASAAARIGLIRRATLDLLASGDLALAELALASLVLAPDADLIRRADLPRIERVLSDATLSIGFRAGLLAELERRGLVDGASRWIALLESASPAELPSAIRAVGAHPSEVVKQHLLALLSDPEAPTAIAGEAAIALGAFPESDVVEALASALAKGDARLRNAAIRGLGRNAHPGARQTLAEAARSHPDAATRNRAVAELRKRETRRTRSEAP